jgi:hypothetical protein
LMFVCCECCVLSGRGLCNGLISHPEESYRLWRVVVCDQETSKNEAKARYRAVENTLTMGCNARKTNKQQTFRWRSKRNTYKNTLQESGWCRSPFHFNSYFRQWTRSDDKQRFFL